MEELHKPVQQDYWRWVLQHVGKHAWSNAWTQILLQYSQVMALHAPCRRMLTMVVAWLLLMSALADAPWLLMMSAHVADCWMRATGWVCAAASAPVCGCLAA